MFREGDSDPEPDLTDLRPHARLPMDRASMGTAFALQLAAIMSNLRARRLTSIDLDRVLGGASTASNATHATVRVGAMPSEVKEALARYTGRNVDDEHLDRASAPAATHAARPATHAAPDKAEKAETEDKTDKTDKAASTAASQNDTSDDSTDKSGRTGAKASTHSSGSGSGNETETDTDTDTNARAASSFHPASTSASGSSVPLPVPRPDFEGQALREFNAQDANNRAHGYYGAFGESPTGPYLDESQHGRAAAYNSEPAFENGTSRVPYLDESQHGRAAAYNSEHAFENGTSGVPYLDESQHGRAAAYNSDHANDVPTTSPQNDYLDESQHGRGAAYNSAEDPIAQNIQSQVGTPELPPPVQFDAPTRSAPASPSGPSGSGTGFDGASAYASNDAPTAEAPTATSQEPTAVAEDTSSVREEATA